MVGDGVGHPISQRCHVRRAIVRFGLRTDFRGLPGATFCIGLRALRVAVGFLLPADGGIRRGGWHSLGEATDRKQLGSILLLLADRCREAGEVPGGKLISVLFGYVDHGSSWMMCCACGSAAVSGRIHVRMWWQTRKLVLRCLPASPVSAVHLFGPSPTYRRRCCSCACGFVIQTTIMREIYVKLYAVHTWSCIVHDGTNADLVKCYVWPHPPETRARENEREKEM